MKLSGNLKIELTDVESGDVTTVEQENMVTNSINNILGTNPFAAFYYYKSNYVTRTAWQENLIPICPNMIGGILLFSNSLDEDVDNLYPTSDNLPVAYASNDVNSTSDLQRGSLSQTEGGETDDGYQFVWEFTATQGNGTIAALALTSALGGAGGYGSIADDASAFLAMDAMTLYTDDDITQYLFNAVEIDFENNTVISIAFSSPSVVITKLRIPIVIIGYDFQITADDTVIQTVGSARFDYTGTPMFQYKNFVVFWGGEYSTERRIVAVLTPYLATICNLDSAVVKTSDMTMKITYTLTESD